MKKQYTAMQMVAAIICAVFIGFCVGAIVDSCDCQNSVIEHQAAHYNPTNGGFEWNK